MCYFCNLQRKFKITKLRTKTVTELQKNVFIWEFKIRMHWKPLPTAFYLSWHLNWTIIKSLYKPWVEHLNSPDLPYSAISQPTGGAHWEGTILDHSLQLLRRYQVSTFALAGKLSCFQFQALRAILRSQHKELPCVGTNTSTSWL